MRPVLTAVLAVVPMLASRHPESAPADACTLLTAQEASTLVGSPVVNVTGDVSATSCTYGASSGAMGIVVEITVGVFQDAATAHTEFRPWNAIDSPLPPTETVITTTGVADEAAITHTNPSELSAIDFRKGTVLVRIGVGPPASDAALKTAALIAASRL